MLQLELLQPLMNNSLLAHAIFISIEDVDVEINTRRVVETVLKKV